MTKMTRRAFSASAAAMAASAGLGLKPAFGQAAYPSRPITMVCPWGAGGGTDAVVRIVATMLERSLGQPVNVVNRTGGSGVVGHSAIANAAPDGYTLGIVTSEIAMMHHVGLTNLTYANYSMLALMNDDPPGVQVNINSPYKDIKMLADAIKAAPPGKMKASGTGQGGVWHLALIGWLQGMGLKPNHVAWVPHNGAAPAMQDLAAGGLDLVTCSVPEGKAMIDAGKAKSLAIMAPERNPLFKDVPTLKETLGIDFSIGSWRGIGGPKNLPENIVKRLAAELKKIYDSKEYKDFMNSRGLTMRYADPETAYKFMGESDKTIGAFMRAGGIAKT
jgi:tripartite-type tricarboxylate transporter receptor subunit TctC